MFRGYVTNIFKSQYLLLKTRLKIDCLHFLRIFVFYTMAKCYGNKRNLFFDSVVNRKYVDLKILNKFFSWFYGLAGILYSYGIVFFCGWRIYANVGKQAFIFESKKTRSAQRQLTITIGMQVNTCLAC
jgi:hypothetical protein